MDLQFCINVMTKPFFSPNLTRLDEGIQKESHSRVVGNLVGVESRTVRVWMKDFCRNDFVVRDRTYTKRKPHSFIDDEDIAEQCREFVDQRIYHRKKGDRRFRVADFQR